MTRSLILALILLLAPAPSRGAEPAAPAPWKAGVARVKITPGQLMWMSGYGARSKPAEGTLHDLWAKALALEDGARRKVVLITLDLVGIPRDLSGAVCAELKSRHGLTRDAILLNVSHTHCGPVVGNNLSAMYFLDDAQQKLVADYAKDLQQKLVTLAGDALKDLSPAQLSWGQGHVSFAVNRRNNKEADVPKLRELGRLAGPVDHDLPVLAVRDPEGKLRAVVCGYACHATVLSFYQWCGDYPGFAQITLEKAYPGVTALFWAGCGADQNPLPRRSVALAESYGQELAAGVESVLKAPTQPINGRLTSSYTEIDLPFAELPTRDKLLQDSLNKDRFIAQRAKLLLEQLEKNGSLRGMYPYPVQAWQLGPDLTMTALGGEVVVDYALRLKRELGTKGLWVAGYSNDVMAYIPSLRVLKEGGYEGATSMVYYGQPTVWGAAIEEKIVAAVQEQVRKVREK
jgi:hypothetical protein